MKSKNKFVYVVVTFLNKLYENKDFFCLKRKLHKYLIIHDNIELTSSITKGEEVV